jgi:hypothetical protein
LWPREEGDSIAHFEFSPDGRRLLALGHRAAAAWSVPDGRLAWARTWSWPADELAAASGRHRPTSVSCSPDAPTRC